MIVRKSEAEVRRIAAAGTILADCLDQLAGAVVAGITTVELDGMAEEYIRGRGGLPTFLGYRGFPGSICASPNDMVVHGGSVCRRRGRHPEPRRGRHSRRVCG
jgi:Methionine aminopeptidase